MSNLFEEVKQGVSILQVLAEYGITPNHENKISCLWHSEKTPSCIINSNNTFKCFGCDKAGSVIDVFMELNNLSNIREAAIQMAERYSVKIDTPEQRKPYPPEHFAEDKGLPLEELKAVGIYEASDFVIEFEAKITGSVIPYYQMDGSPARPRFRYGPKASHGIQWKTKSKSLPMVPYGVWLIDKMIETGLAYIVLVEGCTDQLTCKHYHIPAIGIPGSTMVKLLKIEYIKPFSSVYIWKEPDEAGEKFASFSVPKRLKEIGYTGKVFIIHGAGTKDPNDLHRACKTEYEFMEKWRDIIVQAEPVDLAVTNLNNAKKSAKESFWPYDHNELGLASFFANETKDRLRFCHQIGGNGWLIFDGYRLAKDEDNQIIEIAKSVICKLFAVASNIKKDEEREKLIDFATKSGRKHVLKAVLELAQSDPLLVVNYKNLDSNDLELNTPSGVVDLTTKTVRPAKITDLNTKLTGAPYIPGKHDPKWDSFLIDVLPIDSTRISYQRCMGYSISGSTEEEKLFMNIGPPGSGKGTAQAAYLAALGDYAGVCEFDTFIVRDSSGGPRNDVTALLGYRVVFASELNEGKRLNEALINQLTGRDRISVRFLFKEFFQAVVKFKIWLSANFPPRIQSSKAMGGIWRRMLKFGFKHPVSEEKRDPKLKSYFEKSPDARAAVLNWLIDGCYEWQQFGLGISEEVLDDTAAYADEQDPIKNFLNDCCLLNPLAKVRISTLYAEYETWSRENGEKYTMPNRAFTVRLMNDGFKQVRDNKARYWQGIGLLEERSDRVTKSDTENHKTSSNVSYIGTLSGNMSQSVTVSQSNNDNILPLASGDDGAPY
jgi:putative DNA primase/helicase